MILTRRRRRAARRWAICAVAFVCRAIFASALIVSAAIAGVLLLPIAAGLWVARTRTGARAEPGSVLYLPRVPR